MVQEGSTLSPSIALVMELTGRRLRGRLKRFMDAVKENMQVVVRNRKKIILT